jgi:putative transcriptional regulator
VLELNREQIAKKLIDLRGDKSREEVANSINISVSALQMYENAQRIPKDEIKVRIAEYYGQSVQSIFFGDDNHVSCSLSL